MELFSGELDREVVIRVESQDGSAIGKQYIIINNNTRYYTVLFLCFRQIIIAKSSCILNDNLEIHKST